MNYRSLAAVLGALMLLSAPLAAATHEKEEGPPNSTFGYIGGLWLGNMVNVVPQEVGENGAPLFASSTEQLETAGTYDCATGAPAAPGPNSGKFSFDVVPMNELVAIGAVGPNDHIVDGLGNTVDGSPVGEAAGTNLGEDGETVSNVWYGSSTYLGYGSERPAHFYPGLVTFYAFVYCGGDLVSALPQAQLGESPGLFGFLDEETIDGDGDGNPADEEFTFSYLTPDTTQGGLLLPGDTRSAGWYMDSTLGWTDRWDYNPTFRFVVNPVLSLEYPGYLGSRYDGRERGCLVNGEAGADSGAFGNCGDAFPSRFTTGATPGQAPVLEDIELFGSLDAAVGQAGLLESASMEATAALAGAAAAVGPVLPSVSLAAPAPMAAGVFGDLDYGNGWKLHLDVVPLTGFGFLVGFGAGIDPLYGSAVTEGPNAYPPGQVYIAFFGLANDANDDKVINTGSSAEWWGIDDLLVAGNQTLNWGDVGRLADAGDGVYTLAPIVTQDFCNLDTAVWDGTTNGGHIPMGSQDIAGCNEGGAPEEGWGTLCGIASNSIVSPCGQQIVAHGRYDTSVYYNTPAGSALLPWKTVVSARVVWPPAGSYGLANLKVPSGVVLPTSGETVLVDEDVYANLLTA